MQNKKSTIFIGKSAAVLGLKKKVEGVAAMNLPVLLTGEYGSAQEEVAREIHSLSPRAKQSFVWVDCSAVQKGHWNIELFDKMDDAHGGTLFLDRVELVPPNIQKKLAEIFNKDGSKKPDVRLIAFMEEVFNATPPAPPLKNKMDKELYQLFSHFPVPIPSLRERREDLPELMSHFLKNVDQVDGVPNKTLKKDVIQFLARYAWPGNIFEMKSTMELMAFYAKSNSLDFNDVPSEILVNGIGSDYSRIEAKLNYKKVRKHLERKIILKVMEQLRGNQTRTASALGLHRNSLIVKLKDLNLTDDYKKMVKIRRKRKLGFQGL